MWGGSAVARRVCGCAATSTRRPPCSLLSFYRGVAPQGFVCDPSAIGPGRHAGDNADANWGVARYVIGRGCVARKGAADVVWAWLRAGGQGGEVAIAGAIRRRGGQAGSQTHRASPPPIPRACACQQAGLPAQLDRKETGGRLPPGGSRVLGIHAPSLPEPRGIIHQGQVERLRIIGDVANANRQPSYAQM